MRLLWSLYLIAVFTGCNNSAKKSRLPYYSSDLLTHHWILPGEDRQTFFRSDYAAEHSGILILYPGPWEDLPGPSQSLLKNALEQNPDILVMAEDRLWKSGQKSNSKPGEAYTQIFRELPPEANSTLAILLLDGQGYVRGSYEASDAVSVKNLILDMELLLSEN